MLHEHKTKIVSWGFNEKYDFVATLYGCTECDETFVDLPIDAGRIGHTHTEYVNGCFSCKLPTLQLSTGDANGKRPMSAKKWDAETDAFDRAQAQGINPSGVTHKEIQDAYTASELMGVPYDGDTMMDAHKIKKSTVDLMKEIDII